MAELVAGLLSAEVGINTLQMSSDYCTSWFKALKKVDKPHKLLDYAIRRAVKIVNLIIDGGMLPPDPPAHRSSIPDISRVAEEI